MRAVSRWPTTCTLKLWVPCNARRNSTARSSNDTSSRRASPTGRPANQGITSSPRSTEIAWPTSSGCTLAARARGISSNTVSSRRRRSREK